MNNQLLVTKLNKRRMIFTNSRKSKIGAKYLIILFILIMMMIFWDELMFILRGILK